MTTYQGETSAAWSSKARPAWAASQPRLSPGAARASHGTNGNQMRSTSPRDIWERFATTTAASTSAGQQAGPSGRPP